FAVVLGGMYSWLGPTVGTALTITLQEYLRVKFGLRLIGMAETIYGLLLVVFIIFLPAGIYGSVRALLARRRVPAPATAYGGAACVAEERHGSAGALRNGGAGGVRGGRSPLRLIDRGHVGAPMFIKEDRHGALGDLSRDRAAASGARPRGPGRARRGSRA